MMELYSRLVDHYRKLDTGEAAATNITHDLRVTPEDALTVLNWMLAQFAFTEGAWTATFCVDVNRAGLFAELLESAQAAKIAQQDGK